MILSRIATHCISTDKIDNLVSSWGTIKSIVNNVFDECFRVKERYLLDTYKVYLKLQGADSDGLYLIGYNPYLIAIHTLDNSDNPFVTIKFDCAKGVIRIDKCIDVGHMKPLFKCDAGLSKMSDAVDEIIDKLEEAFGKKKETKMDKDVESVLKALDAVSWDISNTAGIKHILDVINNLSKAAGSITRGTIKPSTKDLRRKKGHPAPTFNEFEQRILKDIHSVMFNRPSTVIFWNEFDENGKRKYTTVTCKPEDTFSKEEGILQALVKHYGITPKLTGYLAKNAEDRTEQTETHKKNKEARRQKAMQKAEKRVNTLLNEEETTATIGFLNNEE